MAARWHRQVFCHASWEPYLPGRPTTADRCQRRPRRAAGRRLEAQSCVLSGVASVVSAAIVASVVSAAIVASVASVASVVSAASVASVASVASAGQGVLQARAGYNVRRKGVAKRKEVHA